MSPLVWRTPWPQWRTHWHVWHAWPLSAQVLLLSMGCLMLSAVGSWYSDNTAWQAWWQSAEVEAEQQQLHSQLQQQLLQMQTTKAQLQAQPHPSGRPVPAWEALPQMDTVAEQAHLKQLAQEHGLQLLAAHEEGGQWRGPLPHLLAAWPNLVQQLPHQRLSSFELKRLEAPRASVLPSHKPSATKPDPTPTVQVHMAWQWTTSLEKEAAVRPVALTAKALDVKPSATVSTPSAGPQVLHNLFAVHGLAKVLPQRAHSLLPAQGLQGESLQEMAWLGMMSKTGQPQALVMQAGLIHRVQVGQAMGQDWGEVVQIASDHLLLREWHISPVGQWQAQTTRFPLATKP